MYSKTVQKIHHEFNTAGDKLLAEAKLILAKGNIEKAKRLEKVGFVNAKEATDIRQTIMSNEIAKLVEYYQQKYPFNKFITKDKVEEINKRYNLVCGPTRVYKGFVPENKLSQIEAFKVEAKDIQPDMVEVVSWNYSSQSALQKKAESENGSRVFSVENFNVDTPHIKLGGELIFIKKYNLIISELMICAPAKDMELKGLKKTQSFFQAFTSVEVKDPIVLQPVNGGYLVVAAWGDEASDKDLVNQIDN